ncbi:hypothetical protein OsJ_27143 [Oryza sativa Japonica Group]|uniref:Uncharacterized protein n=1 Tax=Oryza sativa subsp. japonica TaxID=39947 RepID=B9G0P1_ORYSJ|nr:hypothetical protein OsJ_27143 [Oryza sativa Japonica Group]
MEPLLQVLAAADSTVQEGLNAQVQARAEERTALDAEWAQLAADRARVDEGRRAVDDMVRVGRKMRQTQLAEIQACKEALDSVIRETEEERQAALIASSALDEALGDIRLQYEAHAEDLAKRIRDARGILDAAAAHERRASEADASLRARTVALEAERRALDDCARSAQEFEATIRWRIEVLEVIMPWCALEDFPPRTEARAREQVREAADAIVSNFEGSAPRFTFGLTSDEESGSGGDDGDDD